MAVAVKVASPTTAYAQAVVAGEIVAGKPVRLACQRHLRDLETGHERGLTFDEKAEQRALEYFGMLCLSEGEFAGKPFILQPFQKFIVGSLFGWKGDDGYRRFRKAYIEIAKGNGKALAIDTPIPTPDGWSMMGDLRVGDAVFDETGQPCRIVATTEVMHDRPCYDVEFDDSSHITADAEHLWMTTVRRSGAFTAGPPLKGVRLADRGKWRTKARTTQEIAETLRYPDGIYQAANHFVELSKPLNLPQGTLPVAPYVLGVWLGDGDSDTARLTMAFSDSEIADQIEAEGETVQYRSKHSDTTARLLIGSGGRSQAARNICLTTRLRQLGVLDNKHIPQCYLRASESQRLDLLQGLLDTDGSISTSGQVEFTSVNAVLARDVSELIMSLGYKVSMKRSDAQLNGRCVGDRWRVWFWPQDTRQDTRPVFRLKRKRDRQTLRAGSSAISTRRAIVNCRPIPSVPVRCIMVDSPSHLYLAGRSMIPTHNSPLAAAVGLYALVADGEEGAEIYSAAVTREQAGILWSDAKHMVEASPALSRRVSVNVRNLAVLSTNSYFRPVSSEARSLDGKRVHFALIDELHEHPSAMVVDKMQAGTKGRRQPLIFEITNSGYDRHSVCYQHHDYSIRILEGVLDDDGWFAYVCALDDKDDWQDESVWVKANPNLGVSVTLKYLREQVREAVGMPAKQNIVKRLNFCIWTEQAAFWIDIALWDACRQPIDQEALIGQLCFGGLDLSSTTDISALVLVFPRKSGVLQSEIGEHPSSLDLRGLLSTGDEINRPVSDMSYAVLSHFWLPEEAIEARVRRDRVPYDVWEREGWLTLTPGNVIDYDYIREHIKRLASTYQLKRVGYDPYNATQLVIQLGQDGLDMVPVRQGFLSLNAPTKELERLISSKGLIHNGDPVLRWMMSNAAVDTDAAGNLKPSKERSREKIDGVSAMVISIDQLTRGGDKPSAYEEHGLLVL